jgi:hypothetical protein
VHLGTRKTIHSVLQLRHFGVEVDKTPRALGGKQRIHTSGGHVIPLSIQNGLAHMDMCPPTDLDYNTYPHVFLTSDSVWDPTSFDDEYTPDGMETEELDTVPDYGMDRVNNFGELLERSLKVQHTSVEYNFNSTLYDNDMDAVIETNLDDNLAHYVDI